MISYTVVKVWPLCDNFLSYLEVNRRWWISRLYSYNTGLNFRWWSEIIFTNLKHILIFNQDDDRACIVHKDLLMQDWMRRPTGDQEVAGSTPADVGNILSWRLIMKYFLRSFSPFRWFKKGSSQFLAKECAQYWLTA